MKRNLVKKIGNCCLFGGPAGLTIWFLFVLWGNWLQDGELILVSGHAVRVFGSELAAFAAAGFSAMSIGMVWASAFLIFRETEWSLLKQTLLNFLVCTLPSLAIAWVMEWMPHSMDGLMQYVRLFAGIYFLIWVVRFTATRRQVQQINIGLKNIRE